MSCHHSEMQDNTAGGQNSGMRAHDYTLAVAAQTFRLMGAAAHCVLSSAKIRGAQRLAYLPAREDLQVVEKTPSSSALLSAEIAKQNIDLDGVRGELIRYCQVCMCCKHRDTVPTPKELVKHWEADRLDATVMTLECHVLPRSQIWCHLASMDTPARGTTSTSIAGFGPSLKTQRQCKSVGSTACCPPRPSWRAIAYRRTEVAAKRHAL